MTDLVPPTIMINWDDKKACWIWVIVQQTATEEITVLDVGANEYRATAEWQARQAMKAKGWLS